MTFGDALTEARGKRPLREIAAAAGCSIGMLWDVEHGNRDMSPDLEARVLSALGLDAAAVSRLRVLAAVARGTVAIPKDATEEHVRAALAVLRLRPEAVARVLRAIERERARAKGEEAGDADR